jgi:hypothetical protein
MAYKIIFAPTAIARLEDIVRYIAADDPATAKIFAMHLLDPTKAKTKIIRSLHSWMCLESLSKNTRMSMFRS